MVNRYVIKLMKIEDACSLEKIWLENSQLQNNIILKRYSYFDEGDKSHGEHFLFYESVSFPINEILNQFDNINISKDLIDEVEDLSEETLKEFEKEVPDVIYITNFPRKFTDKNVIELLSALPYSENPEFTPKLERLPCVFKITFDKSGSHIKWIQSILRFLNTLEFASDEIAMSAETNCLNVPVIHFLDLPPAITTIEYFIEITNAELGNYLLYEENERKDDQPLSFNVSYSTNDDAWDTIDLLNFRTFEGKEIRVNHFIDTKKLHEMQNFNIKVTNYEGDFNSYEIYDKFLKFGSIYSIYNSNPLLEDNSDLGIHSLQANGSNPQNDFFCIQYYLKNDAINAIRNAQKELEMKNLTLTTKDYGIVVYNFENDITEMKVKELFPDAIKVLVKKSKDKNSRPYVFINFICQEDCDKVRAECKDMYRNHLRLMCVSQTLPKDQAFLERKRDEERCQKINTIFISKVPENVYAEDVIQECSRYGNIDSAVFIDIKNKKNKKRIAKISFHTQVAFQNAMKMGITLSNIKIKPSKYLPHSH